MKETTELHRCKCGADVLLVRRGRSFDCKHAMPVCEMWLALMRQLQPDETTFELIAYETTPTN